MTRALTEECRIGFPCSTQCVPAFEFALEFHPEVLAGISPAGVTRVDGFVLPGLEYECQEDAKKEYDSAKDNGVHLCTHLRRVSPEPHDDNDRHLSTNLEFDAKYPFAPGRHESARTGDLSLSSGAYVEHVTR